MATDKRADALAALAADINSQIVNSTRQSLSVVPDYHDFHPIHPVEVTKLVG
jgi:hypothetical protein